LLDLVKLTMVAATTSNSSKQHSRGEYFGCHLAASAIAAIINFPLWKASAIGQSGFDKAVAGSGSASSTVTMNFAQRYVAALKPPYKGVTATIGGMTWARAFIFYGSDRGKVGNLFKH
jgi:hypothetical protein